MGCCGGSKIEKAGQIAQGHVRHADRRLRDIFGLPVEKYDLADCRIARCQTCPNVTAVTERQYSSWVESNGGWVKFFAEFDDLSAWAPLPQQDWQPGMKRICQICKCPVIKKAYAVPNTCPLAGEPGGWKR